MQQIQGCAITYRIAVGSMQGKKSLTEANNPRYHRGELFISRKSKWIIPACWRDFPGQRTTKYGAFMPNYFQRCVIRKALIHWQTRASDLSVKNVLQQRHHSCGFQPHGFYRQDSGPEGIININA